MARAIFGAETENQTEDSTPSDAEEASGVEASARRRPRRQPLSRVGVTSDKYIKPAVEGGAERTIQDIQLSHIGDSYLTDRVLVSEDIGTLAESMREIGQEVPIKVRLTNENPAYEVVVGRRRIAAAKSLGWKTIKALVVRVDDRTFLRSLISENTARKESSFIGRAQLSARATEKGHSQAEVSEAFQIDPSLLNRMIRIYEDIGSDIISIIGDAPGIGRNKWSDLRALVMELSPTPDQVGHMIDEGMKSYGTQLMDAYEKKNIGNDTPMNMSDLRFEVLLSKLKSLKSEASASDLELSGPGRPKGPEIVKKPFAGFGTAVRKGSSLTYKLEKGMDHRVLDEIEAAAQAVIDKYRKR